MMKDEWKLMGSWICLFVYLKESLENILDSLG